MRKRQISKMTALMLVAALCAGCGSGGDNRAASDGTAQTEADNGQEGTAVDTAESTKADGGNRLLHHLRHICGSAFSRQRQIINDLFICRGIRLKIAVQPQAI